MRKLNYLLTEISSYFFIKVCLAIVLCIVTLCSVQFFQAYQTYRQNTIMLTKNIGDDAAFRLIDVSAERVANQQIGKLIAGAEKVFDSPAYYFLNNPGFYYAEKSLDLFTEAMPAISNEAGEELVMPKAIVMNEALMKKINLQTEKGAGFSKQDFSGETKCVILGNAYQKKFKVGEEIELKEMDGYTKDNQLHTVNQRYQIIGFLPDHFEMMNFWQGDTSALSLDETIVFPLMDTILQQPEESLHLQLMGYFFLLSPEQDSQLAYLDTAEQIRELGKKSGYRFVRIQNDRSLYKSAAASYRLVYQNKLYLLGLLLVFSLLQVAMIIVYTFKKRENVYEIYFSIGSTKKEIFIVLLGESILLFLFGFSLFFLLNSFYLKETWSYQAQLLGIVLYFTVFLVIATIVIGRQLFADGNYFRREK